MGALHRFRCVPAPSGLGRFSNLGGRSARPSEAELAGLEEGATAATNALIERSAAGEEPEISELVAVMADSMIMRPVDRFGDGMFFAGATAHTLNLIQNERPDNGCSRRFSRCQRTLASQKCVAALRSQVDRVVEQFDRRTVRRTLASRCPRFACRRRTHRVSGRTVQPFFNARSTSVSRLWSSHFSNISTPTSSFGEASSI